FQPGCLLTRPRSSLDDARAGKLAGCKDRKPALPLRGALELLQEVLAKFLDFGRHHCAAVRLTGITLVVLLVIPLGGIVVSRRRHFRDDRPAPYLGGAEFGDHALGGRLLLWGMVENRRSILGSKIVALIVESRRIVNHEKYLQQFLE